jgi:hypothetical protein
MQTEKGNQLDRFRTTSSAHCFNLDRLNFKNIPFAEISNGVASPFPASGFDPFQVDESAGRFSRPSRS